MLSDVINADCLKVPEYCKVISDSEVAQHAFELIFAFDEIVALGYRENVNLSQIRIFTEMDSHDENVFMMLKKVRTVVAMHSCYLSVCAKVPDFL